ncbi:MAG: alpha/beta hydrolase [Erythrobacter sp.]
MERSYQDRFWTSADGLNLHFRDYPAANEAGQSESKLPVVCLHGLTRNARDFSALAKHLSRNRRVLVPEMRGRGLSDYAAESDSYNPAQYVADVEKLLTEEGVKQFIAIGTSMGGLMTMLLAKAAAGRIAAAVINDIGPAIEPEGVARIANYVGQGGNYPTWLHAARSMQDVHHGAFPEYGLDQWLEMAKRTLVVSQNGRINYDYDMAIAEPFSRPSGAAPPDLWDAFEALSGTPILLVRGELSDLLSPETVKRMQAGNPKLELITVPKMGHAPTLDETAVREAIDTLLAPIP